MVDGGCVEVTPEGRIKRVISSHAYGYAAAQLIGGSLWSLSHQEDRQPLMHTLNALLATVKSSAGPTPTAGDNARPLRLLHRMIYRQPGTGQPRITWMDTMVTACEHDGAQTLLLSSRCSMSHSGMPGDRNEFFRVLPCGPPT